MSTAPVVLEVKIGPGVMQLDRMREMHHRSGTPTSVDYRVKRWETQAMSRLFRSKIDKDEHGLTVENMVKMNPTLLSEVIAESVWRAVGWIHDERPNVGKNTLRHEKRWRSTKWWQSTKGGNTSGAGTTVDVSGTKWPLNRLVMRTGPAKKRNAHLRTRKDSSPLR